MQSIFEIASTLGVGISPRIVDERIVDEKGFEEQFRKELFLIKKA